MTIDADQEFPPVALQDAGPSRIRPHAGRRGDDRAARPGRWRCRSAWRSPKRRSQRRYGADLVDHRTYVICGDGCLMEGVSHEAIDLAGHLKLKKLTVLWDNNHISIDGSTSLATSMRPVEALRGGGLAHDRRRRPRPGRDRAPRSPRRKARTGPTFIACRTTIGFGAPNKQGTEGAHGSPLGEDEVAATREKPQLALPAVRDSRRHPRRLAQGRRALAQRARGVGGAR